MWESLKTKAKNLVTKHGSEVGAVAKIAAHALIPGAPLVVSAVEALCDYSVDKMAEVNDEALQNTLEQLGADVVQLEVILGHLGGQLAGMMTQMSQMASFGTPPQALEAMINSALELQFSSLRDEVRALAPELESVKRQQAEMLQKQALQGDMLVQVQDSIDAALVFNAPLASEGILGANVTVFLAALGKFQSALLNGDLSGAEQALAEMEAISPNGNTYRVNQMALKAAQKDFAGAEQIARTIAGPGANHPRLQRARQSLTKLTQARSGMRAKLPISNSSASNPTSTKRYKEGDQIGDRGWTLSALLGRGGMGSVWRAKNRRGQEGAIKLMNAELGSDEQFVSRFQSEIDALDKVNHPAVVPILDWGCDRQGTWYFVMPFIQGSSLRVKLNREQLSEKEVLNLAIKLTSGLVACHAQHLIHRDIKPENIMLKSDGSPVLIDFGIAHQEGQSTGQTQMATAGYAPPEQLGGRRVDHSADIFALGIILGECLGAQVSKGKWVSILAKITNAAMPSTRGTAQELLELLTEAPKKYHANSKGQTLGPLSAQEAAKLVINEDKKLLLWWPQATNWVIWNQVKEVQQLVDQLEQVTPPPLPTQPTPPPAPTYTPEANPAPVSPFPAPSPSPFRSTTASSLLPTAAESAQSVQAKQQVQAPSGQSAQKKAASPYVSSSLSALDMLQAEDSKKRYSKHHLAEGFSSLPAIKDQKLSNRTTQVRSHLNLLVSQNSAQGHFRFLRPKSPDFKVEPWVILRLSQLFSIPKEILQSTFKDIENNQAYNAFTLTTPSKDRYIQAAKSPLKEIQKRILSTILYASPMSAATHGGQPHRSLVTNATPHLHRSDEFIKLDIKDAYPSVSFKDVFNLYYTHLKKLLPILNLRSPRSKPPLYSKRAAFANALAILSTIPNTQGNWSLPQGASTSAALLNLACAKLDRMIYRIIKDYPQLELRYTRFIDDITISASVEIPDELIKRFEQAVIKADFDLNHRKKVIHRNLSGPFSNVDSVTICGLKVRVKNSRLSFSRNLQERLNKLLGHGAHAYTAQSVISFTKQVYSQTPRFLSNTPWLNRHPAQGWSDQQPAYYKQIVTRGGHRVLDCLSVWLDLSPKALYEAVQLVKKGQAYQQFRLAKGNGSFREIHAPCEQLKLVQTSILWRLLYQCPVSACAHGFVPQRSIVTNARPHLASKSIFNLDLKDAFPSIKKARVLHTLKRHLGHSIKHLGPALSEEERKLLWTILVELLTHKGALPQGSPASGYLLNLCLISLDRILSDLTRNHGVTYTRYADDLTFSTKHSHVPSQLCSDIIKTIIDQHLVINFKKLKNQSLSKKGTLEVCGLLVDAEQPRIPPKKLKAYRSMIRKLTFKETLSESEIKKLKGTLSFVNMVYGCIPNRLSKPLEKLYLVHPQLKSNVYKPQVKFSLYSKSH